MENSFSPTHLNPFFYSQVPFTILAIYVAMATYVIAFALNQDKIPKVELLKLSKGKSYTFTDFLWFVVFLFIMSLILGFILDIVLITTTWEKRAIIEIFQYENFLERLFLDSTYTYRITAIFLCINAVFFVILIFLFSFPPEMEKKNTKKQRFKRIPTLRVRIKRIRKLRM